ncbi:copper transporter [Calidifontibacter terrae]
MIDFRYHVVSLVAVFLALATGIVIGGFSLRGTVADQLNGQVVQLRSEKSSLQSQLNQSGAVARKHDDAVTELTPTVLSGTLRNQTVAILALPGTDGDLLKSVGSTLRTGGATVVSTTTLDESLVQSGGPSESTWRSDAGKLGLSATEVPTDRLPGAVLARALTRDDPVSHAVLDQLAQEGALKVDSKTSKAASGIVVVWNGMSAKASSVKNWGSVISGVGSTVNAVVGVSQGQANTTDGSSPDALIGQLRDTPDTVAAMSTVDDGSSPLGQLALGLALRDEVANKSGQYGLGRDASAVLPRVVGGP